MVAPGGASPGQGPTEGAVLPPASPQRQQQQQQQRPAPSAASPSHASSAHGGAKSAATGDASATWADYSDIYGAARDRGSMLPMLKRPEEGWQGVTTAAECGLSSPYSATADPNLSLYWVRKADMHREARLAARRKRLQRDRDLQRWHGARSVPLRACHPPDSGRSGGSAESDSPRGGLSLNSHRSHATSLYSGASRARRALSREEIGALRALADPPTTFRQQVLKGADLMRGVSLSWLRQLRKDGDYTAAAARCNLNLAGLDTDQPPDGRPLVNSPRSIIVLLRNGVQLDEVLPAGPDELRARCELYGLQPEVRRARLERYEERRKEMAADLVDQYKELRYQANLGDVIRLLRIMTDEEAGAEDPAAAAASSPTAMTGSEVMAQRRRREADRMQRKEALRRRVVEQELARQQEAAQRQMHFEQQLAARNEERVRQAQERAQQKSEQVRYRQEVCQEIQHRHAEELEASKTRIEEQDRVRQERLRRRRERERRRQREQGRQNATRIAEIQRSVSESHEERLRAITARLSEVARKAAIIEREKQEAAAAQERRRNEASATRREAVLAKAAELLDAHRSRGEKRQKAVEARLANHLSERADRQLRRQDETRERAEQRRRVRDAAQERQVQLVQERVEREEAQAAAFQRMQQERRAAAQREQEEARTQQRERVANLCRQQKAQTFESICLVGVLTSKVQRVDNERARQEDLIRKTRRARERVRLRYEQLGHQLEERKIECSKRNYAEFQKVANPKPTFKRVVDPYSSPERSQRSAQSPAAAEG